MLKLSITSSSLGRRSAMKQTKPTFEKGVFSDQALLLLHLLSSFLLLYRLLLLCGQTTLPDHHRALLWEWLVQWPLDSKSFTATGQEEREKEDEEGEEEGGEAMGEERGVATDHTSKEEEDLKQKVLQPSPFDSLGKQSLNRLGAELFPSPLPPPPPLLFPST